MNSKFVAAIAAIVILIAAVGAYLHGLAAGLAADCEQRGWSAPAVYGQHHTEPTPAPGHPIIASDIVAAIPRVFEEVIQ